MHLLGKNGPPLACAAAMPYCLLMTKKDFIAIAKVLDANHAPLALVSDFADMCEETNPLFDRQRFVEASTVNMRKDAETSARLLDRELGRV